jgi:DNA polymerase-3 subunit delta
MVLEWLKKRAKKFKKQLSEPAARLLVAHLGTDLRTHANELEKLITFSAGSDTITEQDIEQVVGVSRTFNVFELTKAIGLGQKVRATEIALRMLAADKDQRQYIFVMIARYVEQLIVAREMLQKGENERAIAEALELRGGAAFFVKEFIEAAKRYSREHLDHAMHSLVELEAETRRVQTSDTLLIERLITQVMPNP